MAFDPKDPHAQEPLATAGPPLPEAAAVLIMLHGRGASPEDMLGLYGALDLPDVAVLAPQAAGRSWYPKSFRSPVEENQPYLDSALRRIGSLVDTLLNTGLPSSRIAILGFSQGACLSCEFAATTPRRYGAILALTGGLVGAELDRSRYTGSLAGTPVFLGTSDPDPHIPLPRVEETAEVLRGMSARVDFRVYPGMPHTVNEDELEACRALLRGITSQRAY